MRTREIVCSCVCVCEFECVKKLYIYIWLEYGILPCPLKIHKNDKRLVYEHIPSRHIYNRIFSRCMECESASEKEQGEETVSEWVKNEHIDCQTTFQYCLINLVWDSYTQMHYFDLFIRFSFFSSHLLKIWIFFLFKCVRQYVIFIERRSDQMKCRWKRNRKWNFGLPAKFILFNFDTWNDQLIVDDYVLIYVYIYIGLCACSVVVLLLNFSLSVSIVSFISPKPNSYKFSVWYFIWKIHRLFHMRKISPETMTTWKLKERHIFNRS